MTDTANLGLPCIQGSQAQKHVTHNEALRILDTLVQLAVNDRDLTAPPDAPSEGERYIVKTGATGAWAGRDEEVAAWQDGVWQFSTPRAGWLAYVIDEGALLAFNGVTWQAAVILAGVALQNLSLVGVGTTADSTNALSVKLNNALFAARTAAEGGDGDLRTKMSKESAANTASLLFQDNYSGRAEFGLTGDDDFHVKVSADGTIWHEAIVIDRTSGQVSFPQSGGSVDLELTLAQLSLGVADALNSAQFIGASGNRFADSFDALTYVDVAGATNLETGSSGFLKPAATGGTQFSTAGLTRIGNMTSGGGLNAAFDGTISQAQAACAGGTAISVSGHNNTTGIDWGSGITKTLGRVRLYGPNDTNILGGGGATTFKIQGSNDNSAWTDLTGDINFPTGSAQNVDVTGDIATATAYRYHRVNLAGNGVNGVALAEVQFFGVAAVGDVTVMSQALTAAAAPTTAKLCARVKEIDSISLNTDLVFSASRDGGTTFTSFTMNRKFTASSIAVYDSNQLDISAQPAGTSMKWCCASANGKSFELHDIYLYWS